MKFGIGDAWLIWSHKRGAWYAPQCRGYTDEFLLAGIYSEKEAKSLAKKHAHLEPRRLRDAVEYLETFWIGSERMAQTVGALLGALRPRRFPPLAIVDDRTDEEKERDGDS